MQGHQNGSEAKYTMNLDTQYSSINFVTLGLRSNGCPHYYITILLYNISHQTYCKLQLDEEGDKVCSLLSLLSLIISIYYQANEFINSRG